MARPRQTVAQQPPDPAHDYRRFPRRSFRAGSRWFRQHDAADGPWWFSSSTDGRFDLPAPNGTCYLANSAQAAARERIGPDMAATGHVPASIVEGRVMSNLALPHLAVAANLDADRAADGYGVTGELTVMTPYSIPQAWAVALHSAGFDGIVGRLRFSLSRAVGLALFGGAGARRQWSADPDPQPLVDVVRRMGIDVVGPPNDDQVTIVPPA